MSPVAERIDAGDYEGLAAYLDGLDDAARLERIRACPGGRLSKLWTLAEGHDVTIEGFAPETDKKTVYSGRNSMPIFTEFSKPVYRPSGGGPAYGFNDQYWRPVTGPGYFILTIDEGTMAFDYNHQPELVAEGWPQLASNDRGILPRVVFAKMVDFNRWVGSRTVVGHATRNGKSRGQYYMITRMG